LPNNRPTSSVAKAKFRDDVRSCNETSIKNEVPLKFLCHNLVVVQQAIIELGIEVTFWLEKPSEKNILKFDCRNQWMRNY